MRLITGSLMFFCFLVGCGSTENVQQSEGLFPNYHDEKTVDVTDYTLCSKGAVATSALGGWSQQRTHGDMQTVYSLRISAGTAHWTAACTMGGHSLKASVTSRIADDGRHIDVLQADEDHQQYKDSKTEMNCAMDLAPMRLDYSFQGSCLVLQKRGLKTSLS